MFRTQTDLKDLDREQKTLALGMMLLLKGQTYKDREKLQGMRRLSFICQTSGKLRWSIGLIPFDTTIS
uniref:Uncharacterized protein n=1 Tax=Rhizophora mucronata TaxID=61149 RepID=A0A2P2MZG1_RHIMU